MKYLLLLSNANLNQAEQQNAKGFAKGPRILC